MTTCQYSDHFAAGDTDIWCVAPKGHAGDHVLVSENTPAARVEQLTAASR